MPYYSYTRVNKSNGKSTVRTVYLSQPSDDIQRDLFNKEVSLKHQRRLEKLCDASQGQDGLPHPFDIKRDDQLACLYEIVKRYEIKDIKLEPNCYGCRENCGGQYDHEECSNGCLHDPETCPYC